MLISSSRMAWKFMSVVSALRKYTDRTGDDSLLWEGGAQVVLECARFYLSLLSKKIISDVYDLKDVVGPDEYHERVDNNAYTNEMARMTLRYAAEVCPGYLPGTSVEELAAFTDAADHLKRQQPDPETGLIEQFDGYFALEDATVENVRSRLLDPREYWGGAYMVLLFGFLGLTFEDSEPVLHPRLPKGWTHVRIHLQHRGKRYTLEA